MQFVKLNTLYVRYPKKKHTDNIVYGCGECATQNGYGFSF